MNTRDSGHWLDIVSALVAIAAGVYLLTTGSAAAGDEGRSWLEVIAHGLGLYMIAKGLFIARSLHLQGRTVALLSGRDAKNDEATAAAAETS